MRYIVFQHESSSQLPGSDSMGQKFSGEIHKGEFQGNRASCSLKCYFFWKVKLSRNSELGTRQEMSLVGKEKKFPIAFL